MTRARSKSTVQSIASDIVPHVSRERKQQSESTETQRLHNSSLSNGDRRLGTQTAATRPRAVSHSFCIDTNVFTEHPKKIECEEVPLFPFTIQEEYSLTNKYLKTFSYNSVLDFEEMKKIDDCKDTQLLAFQADCDRNIQYFKSLLVDTNNIMEELGSLTFHYDQVVRDTEEFADQSRDLLNKQTELGQRAAEMDHVMSMFEPLESISKTLSISGTTLIRSGRWRAMLSQLHENLIFFESHKSYKDAEIYTMRYRQCITRALTLIRNYNIQVLKDKITEVTSKLSDKNFDSLKLDIMMYSEFAADLEKQTDNTRFPILMQAITNECSEHKEYEGLVSDVLHQYFKLRNVLVSAFMKMQAQALSMKSTKAIKDSASQDAESPDIVKYCQRTVSRFKRLLEKEFTIYCKYFPLDTFDDVTRQYVERQFFFYSKELLEPLYDEMRNKILNETSISELSHLTNLLASYYEFEDDTASISSAQDNRLEYGELLEPILNDSQARLIFRIQNYIDNKLLKFKPRPEDLQLGNRRKSAGRETLLDDFEENLYPELYVPVGKALTILSNLFELINSMVFDDIAHYIVHSCIFMLENGAMSLAISHLGPADAKLFYLKNLTILKNHLNTFDIQSIRAETSLDLTGGIQELIKIIRSGRLSVSLNAEGGFLELVKKSAPKVINDMIDANKEIEFELSNTFNDFVTDYTNIICEPILKDDDTSLRQKAANLNDNVLMKFPHIHKQVGSYIEQKEFVGYLLNVLSRLIFSTYETYHRAVEEKFATSEHAEQLNEIMEPDTFFNFLAETITGLQDTQALSQDSVELNEDILKGQDAIFKTELESEMMHETIT